MKIELTKRQKEIVDTLHVKGTSIDQSLLEKLLNAELNFADIEPLCLQRGPGTSTGGNEGLIADARTRIGRREGRNAGGAQCLGVRRSCGQHGNTG